MLRRLGNGLFAIVLGSGAADAQVTFNTGVDLLDYCRLANDAVTGRGMRRGVSAWGLLQVSDPL
jgi:hypothetical protein